jgi:hypothetical protein
MAYLLAAEANPLRLDTFDTEWAERTVAVEAPALVFK